MLLLNRWDKVPEDGLSYVVTSCSSLIKEVSECLFPFFSHSEVQLCPFTFHRHLLIGAR